MRNWFVILLSLITASALAGDPVITCEPRELRGVPGQPLQAELTVESDRANPIQLRIPAVRNLFLRTVEKIPIRRTAKGRYIQKRIIIWQGIEAGATTLTNLTVNFQGLEPTASGLSEKFQELENMDAKSPNIGKEKQAATQLLPDIGKAKQAATQLLPSIGITINTVTPAEPPAKKEAE